MFMMFVPVAGVRTGSGAVHCEQSGVNSVHPPPQVAPQTAAAQQHWDMYISNYCMN